MLHVNAFDNLFGFLYKYKTTTEVDLKLVFQQAQDVSDELSEVVLKIMLSQNKACEPIAL